MEKVGEAIQNELNMLRTRISSDFAALALVDHGGYCIRWRYASGNEGERFGQITLRMGRGLAGTVVRLGRPVVLDATDSEEERIRREYSIMLAENLHAAIAVPVTVDGETCGVLLAGDRSKRVYGPNDIREVSEAGETIARILKQIRLQTP